MFVDFFNSCGAGAVVTSVTIFVTLSPHFFMSCSENRTYLSLEHMGGFFYLFFLQKGWIFLTLWDYSKYADGDAEFVHSCVDKFAIVSISSHKESYPSWYVVVPLIIDDNLYMDTQFLRYMDYGLILMDGEGRNQHTDLYLGLNGWDEIEEEKCVRLCICELKP